MKTESVNNRICDAHLEAKELESVIAPGFTINHNDTFLAPTFALGGAGVSLQTPTSVPDAGANIPQSPHPRTPARTRVIDLTTP